MQRLGDLVAAPLRQIDDSDYDSVAEQVAAMEAVVAQVNFKQIDDRVEKLEKELAELKRELERHGQDRWPWAKTLGRTVAVAGGVLLSDGLRSKLRGVRNLLNLILDE